MLSIVLLGGVAAPALILSKYLASFKSSDLMIVTGWTRYALLLCAQMLAAHVLFTGDFKGI